MRLPIDREKFKERWFALCALLLLFVCPSANAQFAVVNPAEYVAYGIGNGLINDTIKSEMKTQQATALLQNLMAGEFTLINGWQKKYNNYLKDASGFASQIKAGSQLYQDGVRCLINLYELKDAVSDNPGGVLASLNMNTLMLETATELLTVYTFLKEAVAKGGNENMLTGEERAAILWELSDKMKALNNKLTLLQRSIRIYTMKDMWLNVTAGMAARDHKEIAEDAHGHWKRASQEAMKIR